MFKRCNSNGVYDEIRKEAERISNKNEKIRKLILNASCLLFPSYFPSKKVKQVISPIYDNITELFTGIY